MTVQQQNQQAKLKMVYEVLAQHHGESWALIPILQDVQEKVGYIPPKLYVQ